MATLVLSAAGAAMGSAVGGSVLGLSMTAIGRFAGASLGRALDARILGQGSDPVETGRMERLRMTGSGEGAPIARVWGRVKVGGHVIWASQFREHITTLGGGGGKGQPSQPQVRQYAYSVSVAMALCEGEISGVSRVWADGVEIGVNDLTMRVYRGTPDQAPDPKMEAVEGTGHVPAYRGLAYVVIEDLMLESFGNRVPQLSFEVVRLSPDQDDPAHAIRAVAMMPGSGDYALATRPVYFTPNPGEARAANVNSPSGLTDFETSLQALSVDAPNCRAASVIVSWFGDDLRCGSCSLTPRVEQSLQDGSVHWSVAGVCRNDALHVPGSGEDILYGGTPSDASVLEAIAALKDAGQEVMFYPFVLMVQETGNDLPDPWTGGLGQPALPWRGRITTSVAPGAVGSPDGTAAAEAEVAAFFGTAQATDFTVEDKSVTYSGPLEWSFRRFILHYAALCAVAGGVESFCIGSELRGLTQIRDAQGFPTVRALRDLAAEVRKLLGPDVRIGYAADWSEYFGYHPDDGSGDVYFHLDPLWADETIDFIGIDNYVPLSDWRDGPGHADAAWGRCDNPGYLEANIEGGEGYAWFYATPEDRDAQIRTPITDGAYNEPWVYRCKDLRNWWRHPHHERIAGVRAAQPTAWVPQSKPIWFTELGCAAVDKGPNAPNLFWDPKSSESCLPPYSTGRRDDAVQRAYLKAMHRYWARENQSSDVYDGPMVDLSRAFVWAWDARPYPWFPNAAHVWTDGGNYQRGHWITGRLGAMTLGDVIKDLCSHADGGVNIPVDTDALSGVVRGYAIENTHDVRSAMQPLLMAYGVDATEDAGGVSFRQRGPDYTLPGGAVPVAADAVVAGDTAKGPVVQERAPDAELPDRVRVRFVEADGAHVSVVEEAALPGARDHGAEGSDTALVLTRSEGRQMAERWLHEAHIARDTLRFSLPPKWLGLRAGDVLDLEIDSTPERVRVDRIDIGADLAIEAVRVSDTVYVPADLPDEAVRLPKLVPATPVLPLMMDLPVMRGDEDPTLPHIAVAGQPWPGTVALYGSAFDAGYGLDLVLDRPSVVGVTQTVLPAGPVGLPDRGAAVRVRLTRGTLETIDAESFLAGGNLFAIGDGASSGWEVFQARDAQLVDTQTWDLSHRLRGRFGTDADMPPVWPAGSYIVALDGAPVQVPLAGVPRGVPRHYRIGPAKRSYDHASYQHQVVTPLAIGLRPFRVAHLRVRRVGADRAITWIRRTRHDGDVWDGLDVPLGEESELYLLRVLRAGTVLREVTVASPAWCYDAAMQAADGVGAGTAVQVAVAQVSARFGAGPFADITLPGEAP